MGSNFAWGCIDVGIVTRLLRFARPEGDIDDSPLILKTRMDDATAGAPLGTEKCASEEKQSMTSR